MQADKSLDELLKNNPFNKQETNTMKSVTKEARESDCTKLIYTPPDFLSTNPEDTNEQEQEQEQEQEAGQWEASDDEGTITFGGVPSGLESMINDLHNISIDIQHQYEYETDYSFFINYTQDIDFHKIADDLNYENPIAIVETTINVSGKDTKRVWAVIHHTVADKFKRSTYDSAEQGVPHKAIFEPYYLIKHSEIAQIKADVIAIKQTPWEENRKSRRATKSQKVQVSYVRT